MKPIPLRMRQRMIEMYERGDPTPDIAAAMGTSLSGTRRVRQYLRERGTLAPRTGTPGPPSQLTEELAGRLRTLVAQDVGATRAELKERLGVPQDVRTVGRWLAELGLTRKKSRSAPASRTARTLPSNGPPGTRRHSPTCARSVWSSSTRAAPRRT